MGRGRIARAEALVLWVAGALAASCTSSKGCHDCSDATGAGAAGGAPSDSSNGSGGTSTSSGGGPNSGAGGTGGAGAGGSGGSSPSTSSSGGAAGGAGEGGAPEPTEKVSCLETGWVSSEVAPSGHLRELVVDDEGRVHIAYTAAELTRLFTMDELGTTTTVDAPFDAYDVAFDKSDGSPHLCSGASGQVASKRGDWHVTALPTDCPLEYCADENLVSFKDCSIAVNGSGESTVTWVMDLGAPTDQGVEALVVWEPENSSNQVRWARSGQGSYYWLARLESALDADEAVHILGSYPGSVYSRDQQTHFNLSCETLSPACIPIEEWTFSLGDLAVSPDGTVFVAASGKPVFCFDPDDSEPTEQVTLATLQNGEWTSERVADLGAWTNCGEAAAPDLALSPGGEPALCWLQQDVVTENGYDVFADTGTVRCAWKRGQEFTIVDVAANAIRSPEPNADGYADARFVDVVFDIGQNGCCHVAYIEASGALRHATDCPSEL